jgi:hypothetical protein
MGNLLQSATTTSSADAPSRPIGKRSDPEPEESTGSTRSTPLASGRIARDEAKVRQRSEDDGGTEGAGTNGDSERSQPKRPRMESIPAPCLPTSQGATSLGGSLNENTLTAGSTTELDLHLPSLNRFASSHFGSDSTLLVGSSSMAYGANAAVYPAGAPGRTHSTHLLFTQHLTPPLPVRGQGMEIPSMKAPHFGQALIMSSRVAHSVRKKAVWVFDGTAEAAAPDLHGEGGERRLVGLEVQWLDRL